MSSTARQSALAAEIGKYHVIAELARGGMGNVYLAALCGPAGFHKLLAVKELKPELADDESYVAMFLEEARLAARLVHPNIVQLNEVSSEGDRHYMAMEYLDGRSLSRITRRFARDGGFPVAAHLRVIADALLGLHYAHELRGFTGEPFDIVHRDVSPLNVMVTFDGQVKLLDFGIAKALDSTLETKAGVLKGRVAYMAPEQASGGDLDRRADIFAIGVMLWEAVAGRRLWPQMSDVEILSRVLREDAPRLRDAVPGVPLDLDAMCARAMARDPDDRYPTAAALLEDLEAHLARRDDRMSMRQIGEAVAVSFAEERYKMNQVIDERLARAGATPHSGVMATFQRQVVGTPSKAWLTQKQVFAPAIWSKDSSRPGPLEALPAEPGSATHAAQPPRRGERAGRVAGVSVLALLLFAGAAVWSLDPAARRPAPPAAATPQPLDLPRISGSTAAAVGSPPPAETPHVESKADAPRNVKTAPSPLKWRSTAKPTPASAAPQAAAPPEEHRSTAVSCDPPYTVDSKGIEHFKAGCM
jgi:serine/threonine protein kinase